MQLELKNQPDVTSESLDLKKTVHVKETVHIKEKKITKFFSLITSFLPHLKKKNKSIISNPFEIQATSFLNSKNYHAYVNMLLEGYTPNIYQKTRMNNLVQDLFFNRVTKDESYGFEVARDISTLEKLLSSGYKLTENDVFEFVLYSNNNILKYNESFFKKGTHIYSTSLIDRKSYPVLSEQMKSIMNTEDFSNRLSTLFAAELDNKKIKYESTISHFTFLLDVAPSLLLKKVSFDRFLEVSEQLQKKPSKYPHDLMNNIINHYYSPNMKSFYRDIKKNYTTNFVEDLLLNKVKRDIETLKEIPGEALNIIESIEKIFNNIQKKENAHYEHLTVMLDKRIPEVLSKYLSIDPEYRTTLKNTQQLNAQDLMLESLQDIHSLFENVSKELNQNLVHSLSATHRYAKSLT